MAIWSVLMAVALQSASSGWGCVATHEVDGRTYVLNRSRDGLRQVRLWLTLNWTSGPSRIRRVVEWGNRGMTGSLPPATPSWIEFSVPLSSPVSAATRVRRSLRLRWPDGTERRVSNNSRRGDWSTFVTMRPSPPSLTFTSTNRDLNRVLWTGRTIRAVAEDRRGRVLGEVDLDFPDPEEPARITALLMPEAEARLEHPLAEENRAHCSFWTIVP